MADKLKYNGQLPRVEVSGYGHFVPGEEKVVDHGTAIQFNDEPCKKEGWEVTFDESRKKKNADSEPEKSTEASPRGPRTATNKD
jgi:hypothetical protein